MSQRSACEMVPKTIIVETTCDGCGKRAAKQPYDWLHFHSSHGDWGNDSSESFEYHDACSARCFVDIARRVAADYRSPVPNPSLTLGGVDFGYELLVELLALVDG